MGCCADITCCRGTPCSRERFFVGTRKTDDGDAGHHRGGLTRYPAEKIRGTAGVVRELCGLVWQASRSVLVLRIQSCPCNSCSIYCRRLRVGPLWPLALIIALLAESPADGQRLAQA